MSAREEVFARIAAAMVTAPPADVPYETISRRYGDRPPHPIADPVALLADRLLDYRARVRTCSTATLSATVAASLAERRVKLLAVPPGLPEDWLSATATAVVRDDPAVPLSVTDLAQVEGVVTGCAVAIAQTGTLVLDAEPDQGRRALTLIPDYHLCVVDRSAVVADVPDALARLNPQRPLTFISGPSATSDIELNRVEGVHGPRTLEVILVSPDNQVRSR